MVAAVSAVMPLEFVNGGGTGSVERTSAEAAVTEVAAGSGLYCPVLFDGYRAFSSRPAAFFALPVTRRPFSPPRRGWFCVPARPPRRGGLLPFPENAALVTILRDDQVYPPDGEQPIEAGDELLFVVSEQGEDELQPLLNPDHSQT